MASALSVIGLSPGAGTVPAVWVSAGVSYAAGAAATPLPERFIPVRAELGDRWLIDDIQTIAKAGDRPG
jgi:hypothetical protein